MPANEAYIVSSVRTAVGKAPRGTLRNFRPDDMAAFAVGEAVERVKDLQPEHIDDVIMGSAFSEAQQGMVLGRVIAQKAGLPDSVPGATVNRFCSSGLQTIAMATQAIAFGQGDVIIAGGAESMSLVPMSGHYFMPNPAIVRDDPALYISMGNTAENVAEKYHIARRDQDAFSLRSHHRALEAIEAGHFDEETVSLDVEDAQYVNGKTQVASTVFKVDEGPRPDTNMEALAGLRPVFRMGGTVTAGNSSQTSDGAAATTVMSKRMIEELGIEPMARLVGYAVAGVEPELMGMGPAKAVPKVLAQVGLSLDDIGLIELNEAFAAQALAVIRELGLNEDTVNINGGAIALGHPLGCTGAKLAATLLYSMKRRGVRYGLCTMCVGGGMGAAGVFENLMM